MPGVPCCPEGDEMWQSVVTGTSLADQLHWEGSTAARLLPLHQAAVLSAWICPLSSGKEIMSEKKKSVTHCKKKSKKSNGPVTRIA